MADLQKTPVSKIVKIPTCIENRVEIHEDVIICAQEWFNNFCNKKPFLDSWENLEGGSKLRFTVYLDNEELQKYYDFEKLIEEGKI